MANKILRLSNYATLPIQRLPIQILTRSYSSALFIPGNKANENFSLLSPYLDFDKRFADLEKLQKELELRGTRIDVAELAKSWEYYKQIDGNRQTLERKKIEIVHRMKKLKKKDLSSEEEKEQTRLITQGRALKEDIKIIKEALWEIEESVVVQALKLPNEINDRTPPVTPIVLSSSGDIREPKERKSHEEIGKDLGLIDYKNPINYYLCGDAALFELGSISYAAKILQEAQMFRVAGTDFARSLVIEGAGLDHEDPNETFILSNNEGIDLKTCNRLHLVGGASLLSFLAMHTKQLINPTYFPLKYFATGRQYTPFVVDVQPAGLFTVCQSSAVQVCVMTKDATSVEYANQFENLVNIVAKLYENLGVHYRVVMRSAGELKNWESLRVSYEMWSANSRRYVEIGHISLSGQYFSKRLLIAYQTPTGRDFPAIISGTVLSIPKLLGCLLEENPNKFTIPPKIAENMPSV